MQVNFEKHKIFLYREDFDNFIHALNDAVNFIQKEQGVAVREQDPTENDLNFDIKF